MTVYRCEDSMESIFTAIYLAYEEKRDHSDTCISLSDDPVLFAEDVYVEPDDDKIKKVMRSLCRIFGGEDYYSLCLALASPEEDKAQAVYRTVVDGLASGRGQGHLFDNLANDDVHRAFALSRFVSREVEHLKGFVRFQELESGVLYAGLTAKSDAVPLLMPHFADRLPQENFMIHDVRRGLFGIHPSRQPWYLLLAGDIREILSPRLSRQEEDYSELFRYFCHKIAIDGRRNSELQRNMLPLRFREYMTEFQKK